MRSLLALSWIVVLMLSVGQLHVGVAHAAGRPLREADWRAVLTNDPAITVDPNAFKMSDDDGPYISVPAPGQEGLTGESLDGYALLDDISYGDLDGDGAEEAVIPTFSGGTAGNTGFLLYREANPPKLVLVKAGYKLYAEIQGRQLAMDQPNYVGFESNCCPSSTTHTVASLQGNRLVTIATDTSPNDVQEPTVWAFYQALSEKRFEDAYAFLSPAFKADKPFDRWRAGYADTQRIEVETHPGEMPTEVLIDLRSTDRQAGGGTVTHRFRGGWTLVWSADQKRWLLDRARIEQVS